MLVTVVTVIRIKSVLFCGSVSTPLDPLDHRTIRLGRVGQVGLPWLLTLCSPSGPARGEGESRERSKGRARGSSRASITPVSWILRTHCIFLSLYPPADERNSSDGYLHILPRSRVMFSLFNTHTLRIRIFNCTTLHYRNS